MDVNPSTIPGTVRFTGEKKKGKVMELK